MRLFGQLKHHPLRYQKASHKFVEYLSQRLPSSSLVGSHFFSQQQKNSQFLVNSSSRGLSARLLSSPSIAADKIMTMEQNIHCEVGCNPDERGRGQELVISVTVWDEVRKNLRKQQPDFDDLEAQKRRADAEDWQKHAALQLKGTHDNANLAKIVSRVAEEGKWFTIEAMADCVAREVLAGCGAPKVTVLIDKPEALRKRGVRTAACEVTRSWDEIFSPQNLEVGAHAMPTDRVMTKEQSVHCEIGCEAHERGRLQELLISITVWDALRHRVLPHQPDFDCLHAQKQKAASAAWHEHAMKQLKGTHNNASLAKLAQRVAEEGRWFTVEALASCLAQQVLAESGAPRVTVRVDKPYSALRGNAVRAAACELTHSRPDEQEQQ